MSKKYAELAMELLAPYKKVNKNLLVAIKNGKARIDFPMKSYNRQVAHEIGQGWAVFTAEDCEKLKNGEMVEPIGPYSEADIQKLKAILNISEQRLAYNLIIARAVKMSDGEWVILDQQLVDEKVKAYQETQEEQAKQEEKRKHLLYLQTALSEGRLVKYTVNGIEHRLDSVKVYRESEYVEYIELTYLTDKGETVTHKLAYPIFSIIPRFLENITDYEVSDSTELLELAVQEMKATLPVEKKKWWEFNVTPDISAKELGQLLVAKFGDWVGTPSEELLEDGGLIIDHLTDNGYHDRDVLESIPSERWTMAWEYFDQVKRQPGGL